MGMGLEILSSSPSSSNENALVAKRPAGRTKFRETRHPVYRGRREAAGGSITATVNEEASCGAPAESSSESDDAGSSETSKPSAHGDFALPGGMDVEMFSRLDLFPETDLGSYYASLAEALLMDPPPVATGTGAYWDDGEFGEVATEFALWSL
ncbi:unnamed protein product [Triticum turgidum subsp. durum]|uniref:Uncharacterized protein n=1 Tax=Triticum turgidum subsp. durum TaxID=4567 RepID=A0A9R0TUZ2_TRITD|nr:unnamed protein product [Triticum turgidum subsp. durum]